MHTEENKSVKGCSDKEVQLEDTDITILIEVDRYKYQSRGGETEKQTKG